MPVHGGTAGGIPLDSAVCIIGSASGALDGTVTKSSDGHSDRTWLVYSGIHVQPSGGTAWTTSRHFDRCSVWYGFMGISAVRCITDEYGGNNRDILVSIAVTAGWCYGRNYRCKHKSDGVASKGDLPLWIFVIFFVYPLQYVVKYVII